MVETGSRSAEMPVVSRAELDRDPHGVFRRFRRNVPVIVRSDGARFVLRAVDVRRLGSDPRLASSEPTDFRAGPLRDFWESAMLFSNGHVHTRRRSQFAKLFSFPVMERLRSEIAVVAHALIDGWKSLDRTDLVDSFATRLPLLVISRIFGLPDADAPRAMSLVCSVARTFSGAAEIEDIPQIEHDIRRLTGGFRRLIDDRQRGPRDDFLSAYLAADFCGSLSPVEAVVQFTSIFVAATETTRTSMASLMLLLLDHRDQWDAVVRDPSCHRSAVIEGLRVEPGVAYFARTACEDVEVDRVVIPAGSSVVLSALSAMRDESIFANPDTFDISRDDLPKSLIVFGAGPHRCLGEALTLIVMEEGLGALASRLPSLRLVGPRPVLFGSASVRRITPVQVALGLTSLLELIDHATSLIAAATCRCGRPVP